MLCFVLFMFSVVTLSLGLIATLSKIISRVLLVLRVIILSAFMLNLGLIATLSTILSRVLLVLSVIILSTVMLSLAYAECYYFECYYAKSGLNCDTQYNNKLSAECHYFECCYAESRLNCDTEHNIVPSNLQIRKLYGIRFYKCFLKWRSDGESTGN